MTKIPIVYETSSEHKPIPVNGAFGGPTLDGFIHATFYFERNRIPKEISIEVDAQGAGTELPFDPENIIIERLMQCSMVFTPEVAKKIGIWLISHANNIEKKETE